MGIPYFCLLEKSKSQISYELKLHFKIVFTIEQFPNTTGIGI